MAATNLAIDDVKWQLSEWYKCADGFRYFIDDYVWIEEKATEQPIKMKLWECQAKHLTKLLLSRLLFFLKTRQVGYTWLCAILALWLVIFRQLQLVVVVSAKEEWAIEFLDRVKFVARRLPTWMLPPISKGRLQPGGQQLAFQHIDAQGIPVESEIKSLTTTEEGAQGKTPTLLILDETARNRYVKGIYSSSKPGIDMAGGRIICISNAIKTGVGWGWTRDTYTASMRGENNFERVFIAWHEHPLRGPNFLQEQLADGMDEEEVGMHYPVTEEEALSSLAGSYFGNTLARHTQMRLGSRGRIRRDADSSLSFEPDKKGIIEFWRFPYYLIEGFDGYMWQRRYAIGSDVSEGLGYTYSVAYVYDRLLKEFVARMRSNRVDADQWAYMLKDLGEFYDKAFLCPARKGPGVTTCQRLPEIYDNVYVREVPALVGSGLTKRFGWMEDGDSVHEMAQTLKTFFRNTTGSVYCGILIDECSTYIRHENGKLGAEEGKFDDCVVGAGSSLIGSVSVGAPPERVEQAPTGWLKKWQDQGETQKSVWSV